MPQKMNINSKIKVNDKCYWCGKQAVGFEHVPPQNLFPKEYRIELIKVPACKEHNQDLSKVDERMTLLKYVRVITFINNGDFI